LHSIENTKQTFKMGFKKLINSKKTIALFASCMLFGTNMLMAQSVSTADSITPAQKSDMWTGVAYYAMLFFIVCLCVAIFGKILKVYDLSLQIQGKKGFNWNNIMGVCCVVFLVVGMYGAYWSLTEQGSMSLPESASAHGVDIDDMFNVTTVICLIVFVITQILLFWFLFRYRGSDKRKAYFLPHNNTIEKIWTIVPAIVLTILVVFGFFTWQRIMDTTEKKGDLNIDVTGHQFAWELRYPGKDGKLGNLNYKLYTAANKLGIDFSDKNSVDDLQADTLVLPVHTMIRINIHAQDVIHSLYMPHFRVQLNAVPGLPTFFKFEPTITTEEMRKRIGDAKFEYLLYCNKICGSAHYNMQKVVRVVSVAEYEDWIAKQKPYLTDALKKELKFAEIKSVNPAKQAANRLALNN
jgi:cytochrome c oxidase subunit 2